MPTDSSTRKDIDQTNERIRQHEAEIEEQKRLAKEAKTATRKLRKSEQKASRARAMNAARQTGYTRPILMFSKKPLDVDRYEDFYDKVKWAVARQIYGYGDDGYSHVITCAEKRLSYDEMVAEVGDYIRWEIFNAIDDLEEYTTTGGGGSQTISEIFGIAQIHDFGESLDLRYNADEFLDIDFRAMVASIVDEEEYNQLKDKYPPLSIVRMRQRPAPERYVNCTARGETIIRIYQDAAEIYYAVLDSPYDSKLTWVSGYDPDKGSGLHSYSLIDPKDIERYARGMRLVVDNGPLTDPVSIESKTASKSRKSTAAKRSATTSKTASKTPARKTTAKRSATRTAASKTKTAKTTQRRR